MAKIMQMYNDLHVEYVELEKEHETAVKQNTSLIRSIGELERALASARVARHENESAQLRELREANAKLRDELREKTLQVAHVLGLSSFSYQALWFA